MNLPARRAKSYLSILSLEVLDDKLCAKISDGREVSIPIAWFPRLVDATPEQLQDFEISPSGYGVHWPQIDEDVSIKSFVEF